MGKKRCITDPEKAALIGHNIKEARKGLGLKQNEMAEKLGVSQNFLYMLEYGKRSPSLYMIRKIAFLSGMSVDELLGDKECGFGEEVDYDDSDIGSDIRQLRESYEPEEIRMALKFARERLEMSD